MNGAAEQVRSVVHVLQAVSQHVVRRQPTAIVGDAQCQLVLVAVNGYFHSAGFRVPYHVAKGLTCNCQQVAHLPR